MFFGYAREKITGQRGVKTEEERAEAAEPEALAGECGGEMAGCVGDIPQAMRTEALEQRFQFDVDLLATWRIP
jgi:hypothetical protein